MLIDKLKADRIVAFKEKFTIIKDVLGVVISLASKEDKIPSDEIVIKAIKSTIKGIDDTLQYITDETQLSKLSMEKEAIEKYLPKQLTNQETLNILNSMFKFEKPTIKEVMSFFSEHYPNRYNGKHLSQYTKDFIDNWESNNGN